MNKFKMNERQIRGLSLYFGFFLIFAMGLLYFLFTDLYLANKSTYLFLGIILAFGCGGIFLLGEKYKHNAKVFYCLKGVSIALAIGFIIFLFKFKDTEIYSHISYYKLFKNYKGETIFALHKHFNTGAKIAFSKSFTYNFTIVLTIFGCVTQIFNLVFNAVKGIEE